MKCDETKPACNRCTSTGRTCDGYVIIPRKKRSDHAISRRPALAPEVGPAELMALDFFQHKTAPALSSYFDAEFWTRLVFQMSYVEPAVLHAMVAVGSLHEQREQDIKIIPMISSLDNAVAKTSYAQDDQFAIAQYNKAMVHLSKRLESESAIEVALLTCILFVCVEFLRGDAEPAVSHFRSGMTIALATLSDDKQRTAKATMQRIKEYILPFLNRIELLSMLFGNVSSWDYPVDLLHSVPDEFDHIRHARDSFVHVANLTVRFIKDMKHKKMSRLVLPDDLTRQAAIMRQLKVWAEKLDKFLASGKASGMEVDAAKTLQMHQIVAEQWLARCTEPEESANDDAIPEFERAIELAEAVQSFSGTREQRMAMNSSTFLFDMEIVSPLYYIASRCRHPLLRRRAIALLKQTQRREGLWDSNMAAAIAERTMEIEEMNLIALDGRELPAEVDRVYNSEIHSEVGTNPRKHDVTFYMKPWGVDGPFKTWKEQIIMPANQLALAPASNVGHLV